MHAVLFAALAATARLRFGGALRVLLLVVAYAALSEVVQGVAMTTRSGDVLDLLADLVGAALGWWAVRYR